MKKFRKFSAMIAVLLVIATFASLFYIAEEENHDCTGEDCPICVCIHQTEQVLKNMTTGLVHVCVFQAVLVGCVITGISLSWLIIRTSLVNQKVRLND